MQTIQVDQRFVLTLGDGTTREFPAGQHEVDDETAAHWYVRAHSSQAVAPAEPLPKIDPPPPVATSQQAPPSTQPPTPVTPPATPPKIPVPPNTKTK